MGEVDQAELDRKVLEDFVVNNADLERLEALLNRFNIFEAVGFVWQEIRHSTFLAFLLDPRASHGLGDAFAKRLLQQAVMDAPNTPVPVTPIELSLWDLGQMEVWREWKRIDIFLLDEREKLAVIIENKIGAGEHGDQLDRYHAAVREEYPGYRLLALYMTPGGDEPSHPEYLPVDYRTVCEILDELAESRASVVEPDAKVLTKHYTEMLRRHIVGDSEIASLSRQIYQKHRRAIDLIYEHRSAHQEAIRKVLVRLIEETPGLVYNTRFTRYPEGEWISFRVQEWEVSTLKVGEGAYKDCILLFVFGNLPDKLQLQLQFGPGDEEIRDKLFDIARDNQAVFNNASAPLERETAIFSRSVLTSEFYVDAVDADRGREIRKQWSDFLENDLPRIDAALKQERWIWESGETGESSED